GSCTSPPPRGRTGGSTKGRSATACRPRWCRWACPGRPAPPARSCRSTGPERRRRPCHPRPGPRPGRVVRRRSEEHTSELQSRENLVCRLLLEKKKCTKAIDYCRAEWYTRAPVLRQSRLTLRVLTRMSAQDL